MLRTRFIFSLLTAVGGLSLLAAACGGDGSSPAATATASVPLPQPTPGATTLSPEISALILPLMPNPEDVPPALGQLESPQTFTPEELYSVAQAVQPSPEEMASWKFLGGASAAFLSLQSPPEEGPEFVLASIHLHADEDGAREFFAFSRTFPSEASTRAFEAQVGREVNQFAEFAEPSVGEETRIISFGSRPVDQETPQYQSYWVYSRQGNMVTITFGRALRGEISLDDLVQLARNMDARIIAADL